MVPGAATVKAWVEKSGLVWFPKACCFHCVLLLPLRWKWEKVGSAWILQSEWDSTTIMDGWFREWNFWRPTNNINKIQEAGKV
jgi:hypothetical protein